MSEHYTAADPESRIAELIDDPADTLLDTMATGDAEHAEYYLVARIRDHEEVEGARVLTLRYAQLTADWSDLSDTFLSNGMSFRVPADETPRDFTKKVAQFLLRAGTKAPDQ